MSESSIGKRTGSVIERVPKILYFIVPLGVMTVGFAYKGYQDGQVEEKARKAGIEATLKQVAESLDGADFTLLMPGESSDVVATNPNLIAMMEDTFKWDYRTNEGDPSALWEYGYTSIELEPGDCGTLEFDKGGVGPELGVTTSSIDPEIVKFTYGTSTLEACNKSGFEDVLAIVKFPVGSLDR